MERSIILSKEEVKWILCGTKTSIRRLIPEQPLSRLCYTFAGAENGTWGYPSETAWNYWLINTSIRDASNSRKIKNEKNTHNERD